jgi:prophage antirepressor-like protein
MDIIKAFKNNELTIHVTIQGSHEEPLFRASDIGTVLEISNIRTSIKDFDFSEKHGVHTMDIIGRNQETTFLTEKGLYKILFKSRKPIAKQFTDWVCEVIKEIRLNGKYELEKQIIDITEQKEQNLLKNFHNKPILYLGFAEDNIIKAGYTNDIESRLGDFKTEIRPDFTFEYVYESVYNREIEKQLFQHPLVKSRRLSKEYNGKIKTELFRLDNKFTLKNLDKIILEIKKEIESIEQDKEKNNEINNLKLQLAKYEIKEKTFIINTFTDPIPIKSIIKSTQTRIQLYSKDTLKLIKTYETIQDACQEINLYKEAVPQSIHRSIRNNTIYKGYRFWGIDRKSEIKEYEIPETIELSKEQTHQRVIMVSKDNSVSEINKIIGIYACTKDAAENLYNSIQSNQIILKNEKLKKSTISQINKSITNSLSIHTNHTAYEHLWYRELEIPENLLEVFEDYKKNNIIPNLKIHKNNKIVYKFKNDELVHTYLSMTDVFKIEKISEKTLKKYIIEKTLYNDHFFSFSKV